MPNERYRLANPFQVPLKGKNKTLIGGHQHRTTPVDQILGVATPATPAALTTRTERYKQGTAAMRALVSVMLYRSTVLCCRAPGSDCGADNYSGCYNRSVPAMHLVFYRVG